MTSTVMSKMERDFKLKWLNGVTAKEVLGTEKAEELISDLLVITEKAYAYYGASSSVKFASSLLFKGDREYSAVFSLLTSLLPTLGVTGVTPAKALVQDLINLVKGDDHKLFIRESAADLLVDIQSIIRNNFNGNDFSLEYLGEDSIRLIDNAKGLACASFSIKSQVSEEIKNSLTTDPAVNLKPYSLGSMKVVLEGVEDLSKSELNPIVTAYAASCLANFVSERKEDVWTVTLTGTDTVTYLEQFGFLTIIRGDKFSILEFDAKLRNKALVESNMF